jgi:hypothetical protein
MAFGPPENFNTDFYAGKGNQGSRYYGVSDKKFGGGRGSRGGPTLAQATSANNGSGRGSIYETVNGEEHNAYVHKTDNVNASADNIKLDFQPNLLDNYDAVTYHFKFFMTSSQDAYSGNVLDPTAQVIIAESGVSDLTIDGVTFDAIAVPSVEAGTGTQIRVKFDIVEPAGAGLLDKIFYESLDLGISNWATMPIFLQLEFRARNPDTSNSDADGAPGSLGNLRWLWALKINNIKADVTQMGTRYTFEAILYNEFAQSNACFTLLNNVSLEKIDTVQNAISELQDKLNKDQLLRTLDNYGLPDVYNFVIDDKIKGYKIHPNKNNTDPKRNDSFATWDAKSAQFTSGTSIDKIIDSILAHTEEYQKAMIGATATGNDGEPINAEISKMKSFWRIITESRPFAFDKRRGDYANEFSIFVIDYDIGVLDANIFQTANITKEDSLNRFATYVNKGILKKKYNYIFTGLNDQILGLDLVFNQAFSVASSRYGGVYINSSASDYGPVAQDDSKDQLEVTKKLRDYIKMQNDATTSTTSLVRALDDYMISLDAAKLPEQTKNQYAAVLAAQKPGAKIDLSVYGNNYKRLTDKTVEPDKAQYPRQLAGYTQNGSVVTPAFVSDINLKSEQTLNVYKNYLAGGAGGQMRPMSFREGSQEKSTGQGIESGSDSGVVKLANIFSLALHSANDVNLIKLKINIKGDPFWLFPHPVSGTSIIPNAEKDPTEAINFLKGSQNTIPNAVNLYGADNYIIVRFRTPRIYNIQNNDGDLDPYTEVDTFSGVYRVIRVNSTFETGKFSQMLDCQLDYIIKMEDIQDLIEENAKLKDIPSTVQSFYPAAPESTYDASNAPDQTTAETARLNAGTITQSAAETARLARSGYQTQSDALQARLKKAIQT